MKPKNTYECFSELCLTQHVYNILNIYNARNSILFSGMKWLLGTLETQLCWLKLWTVISYQLHFHINSILRIELIAAQEQPINHKPMPPPCNPTHSFWAAETAMVVDVSFFFPTWNKTFTTDNVLRYIQLTWQWKSNWKNNKWAFIK